MSAAGPGGVAGLQKENVDEEQRTTGTQVPSTVPVMEADGLNGSDKTAAVVVRYDEDNFDRSFNSVKLQCAKTGTQLCRDVVAASAKAVRVASLCLAP